MPERSRPCCSSLRGLRRGPFCRKKSSQRSKAFPPPSRLIILEQKRALTCGLVSILAPAVSNVQPRCFSFFSSSPSPVSFYSLSLFSRAFPLRCRTCSRRRRNCSTRLCFFSHFVLFRTRPSLESPIASPL